MSKLEALLPNSTVKGIRPDSLVTVVNVQWFGSTAVDLTYKTTTGKVTNELLYRRDERRIEVVGAIQRTVDSSGGRRLADLRGVAVVHKKSRHTPLQICRAVIEGRALDLKTLTFFTGLPPDEKHYWISSLYTLLMPAARRRRLAAYFTPPHLAEYAIDRLLQAGVRLGKDRILDPASGGAAFLLPLASRIAKNAQQCHDSPDNILKKIDFTLHGVEIDRGLSLLSKMLLNDLLKKQTLSAGRKPNISITQNDTLALDPPEPLFDAVIGNPPYGRIFRPTKKLLKNFAPAITDGYVNLYALFLEQSLRFTKPGGIIALVVPMSFLGGPYFKNLRKRILMEADVLSLDPVDKRSDVFLDVLYDVCILTLQKKQNKRRAPAPTCSLLTPTEPHRYLGNLELPKTMSGAIWALPDKEQNESLFQAGLETLNEYGYVARTGYFVWNREQDRYRVGQKPRKNEVPLFWAHNVKPGELCRPYDDGDGSTLVGFVKFNKDNTTPIIRNDAIILQRTSNRRQPRRLIAAIARLSRVPGKSGFITENHTIVIVPNPQKKQAVSLSVLCRLINTAAVDARFRRISGSVSVSTKALNQLPLPAAVHVRSLFTAGANDEDAGATSYRQSTALTKKLSRVAAAR
jgi:adenine-specific DNA-methyltransferase